MPSNRPLQGTTSSLGHNCTQAERDRAAGVASENGKHGPTNPSQVAALEYAASTNIHLWSISSTNRITGA